MFRLPIDTAALTLLAATTPEPVVDFTTRQPKTDADGQPLYQLQLVVLGDDEAEVVSVKVPGQPKGITAGAPVKVTGLVAMPWSMADRSGVSYRATRVEPTGGPTPARQAS
jgi:hypothetical protein